MRLLADENMVGLDALPREIEVHTAPGRAINAELVKRFDALWVRSVTPVDAGLIKGSRLRFVGSATAGLEHVDRAALDDAGIEFASAPGANAMAVVEYVIAGLLAAERPWQQLCAGASLGIVGYGNVGRRLAIFARAMGWETRICDPWVARDSARESGEGAAFVGLDRVLACDVISLHCSLHREAPWPSFHLLDAQRLEALAAEQWLVNASRGAVIDNAALRARIRSDDAPQLLIDVWEDEPELDWGLLEAPSLRVASAHIAGYSWDAKWAAVQQLLAAMHRAGLLSGTDTHLVTPPVEDLAADWPRCCVSPRDVMHAIYDPCEDDRRMRGLLSLARKERAAAFDGLRRDYRLRREVSAVLIERGEDGEQLTSDEGRRLVGALRRAALEAAEEAADF
ncbi:MAG: 4-phosphoerythronate dehydrogenase [Halieaceae bacterium]|jgi:erythronate-4-phosphate dehydrogenase|nr:4-phosphoerythronate dehydrogenase [Halieaceae bacterium]